MVRTVTFKHGETIITAGSKEKVMYVILQGDVVVELSDRKNTVKVATLVKGDFFGEISFFSEIPRSAQVTAQSECVLAMIESLQQLNSFLSQNPKFAIKMVHILSQRLAKTDELLMGKVSDENRVKTVQSPVDKSERSGESGDAFVNELESLL